LVRATKLGLLATMLGSGAFAMTLMACYGCPDCTIDTYARDAEADATEDSGQVVPVDDSGTSDAAPDAHQGDSGKDAGSDADADAG